MHGNDLNKKKQIVNSTTNEILNKCKAVVSSVAHDTFSFGEQSIIDPDNGEEVKVYGIDKEKNADLLSFHGNTSYSLINLNDCLDDLVFLETLFSAEHYPSFINDNSFSQYFKITYQHWLIKTNTLFDCILQATNAVYDLGLKQQFVNSNTVMENTKIYSNNVLYEKLKIFKQVLEKKFKAARNSIIHRNEFHHQEIDEIAGAGSDWFLILNELDKIDIQVLIGNTSLKLKEQISLFNFQLATTVLEIIEIFFKEYKNRFSNKIVK